MVKIRIPLVRSYNYAPTKTQLAIWDSWWGRKLRKSDTFQTLQRIEAAQALGKDGGDISSSWLMPFRDQLRSIYQGYDFRGNEGELDAVRYYLANCPSDMIPICLSLLGRCTGRFRLYELKLFGHDPSPRIRKHAAKALRRFEAWKLLEDIAQAYPEDPTTHWIATAPTQKREFRERLRSFSENLDHSLAAEAAGPSRMPYWSLYTPWQGKPSKSVEFIREILWRIRRWVHGSE